MSSLPLGAIGVTPLEMASAYATFANYGWQSPPTIIARVTDGSGNVLIDNTPKPQRVLDPWASAAIINVMQSVVEKELVEVRLVVQLQGKQEQLPQKRIFGLLVLCRS